MLFQKIRFLLGILFFALFFHIYQHNLFIKKTYMLQHIHVKKKRLIKLKNNLLIRYWQQRNAESLYTWAVDQQGMSVATLDHIESMTHQF